MMMCNLQMILALSRPDLRKAIFIIVVILQVAKIRSPINYIHRHFFLPFITDVTAIFSLKQN